MVVEVSLTKCLLLLLFYIILYGVMVAQEILVLLVQVRILLQKLLVVMTIFIYIIYNLHLFAIAPQVEVIYTFACGVRVFTDNSGCRMLRYD